MYIVRCHHSNLGTLNCRFRTRRFELKYLWFCVLTTDLHVQHEGSTNKVILNTAAVVVGTESVNFDADVYKLTVQTEIIAFKYKVTIHEAQRNTVLKQTHFILQINVRSVLLTNTKTLQILAFFSAVYISRDRDKIAFKIFAVKDKNKRTSASAATSKFCTVDAVAPSLTPCVAIKYIVPPVWH